MKERMSMCLSVVCEKFAAGIERLHDLCGCDWVAFNTRVSKRDSLDSFISFFFCELDLRILFAFIIPLVDCDSDWLLFRTHSQESYIEYSFITTRTKERNAGTWHENNLSFFSSHLLLSFRRRTFRSIASDRIQGTNTSLSISTKQKNISATIQQYSSLLFYLHSSHNTTSIENRTNNGSNNNTSTLLRHNKQRQNNSKEQQQRTTAVSYSKAVTALSLPQPYRYNQLNLSHYHRKLLTQASTSTTIQPSSSSSSSSCLGYMDSPLEMFYDPFAM